MPRLAQAIEIKPLPRTLPLFGVVYARKLPPITPTRPLQHIVREMAVSNRRILVHFHLFHPLSQQVFHGPDIPWGYSGILSEVIVDKEPEFWAD
jgi:hypothetical protein